MTILPMPTGELLVLAESHLAEHAYPQAQGALWRAYEGSLRDRNYAARLTALRKLAICQMALGNYSAAHALLCQAYLAAAYDLSEMKKVQAQAAENLGNLVLFMEAQRINRWLEPQLRMKEVEQVEPECLRILVQAHQSGEAHWFYAFALTIHAQVCLVAKKRDLARTSLAAAGEVVEPLGHPVYWLQTVILDLKKQCA
jgi:hypothetical protein